MIPNSFQFTTIGIIHSCYKEKFAIPRQAGLVKSAQASIELIPPYNQQEAIIGLDEISHLWVSFIFHQHLDKSYKPLVRPPRLNGEKKGVYATRSPFRPNPLGLSVVRLEKIEQDREKIFLHISGGDFLDQTPVVDIKPYVCYSDSIPKAKEPYTEMFKPQFSIQFSQQAQEHIKQIEKTQPNIRQFVVELLSQDPRPVYTKKIKNEYAAKVYDYDLVWRIDGENILVIDLKKI